MRGWRLLACLAAGAGLGVLAAGVLGVWRVLGLLAEDEARERVDWHAFPDPD